MLLRELFDKPVEYEWTSQHAENWEAEFIVGGVMYEFMAYMSNPYPEEHEDAEVEIEFYHRTETGVPTHKVTGVGNQHQVDRKSTRLNSSHIPLSRMPSSA